MKKKAVFIGIFSALILLTLIVIAAVAATEANRDLERGDDLFSVSAAFVWLLGAFPVLYEADLCCTLYYFIFSPKTKVRTLLNIGSHGLLALFFMSFTFLLSGVPGMPRYVLFAFFICRAVYWIVSACVWIKHIIDRVSRKETT